jgi:RND family efflux transporter MFP subunit
MIAPPLKLLILGLSLMLMSACDYKTQASPPPVVKTQAILLTDVHSALAYSGFVCARYESQLSFQVNGKIKSRNVDLGETVKKGQLLLEIDSRDLDENVRLYAAGLEVARAQALLTETEFKRYEQLYRNSTVSQSSYDQYKTSFVAAEEALRQAEAQYKQSLNALDYAKLRADADGVVTAVHAEADQVVTAGQPVVALARNTELEVEVDVSETVISELKTGEVVKLNFWALDGFSASGKIREISPLADRGTRTYPVRISLNSSHAGLHLGMTATAILKQKDRSEILLPTSALYQTGAEARVWLVKNKRVNLAPVLMGGFVENQVKIVSGLAPGDIVVVAGVHKLFEGQSVRLMDGD